MTISMSTRQSTANPECTAIANALLVVIKRLEGIMAEEDNSIETFSEQELQRCIDRKSECLLELTRWSRMPEAGAASSSIRPALVALRTKLEANARLHRLHIDAMHEVTEAVSDAIRASESDGTYSRGAGRRGAKEWSNS